VKTIRLSKQFLEECFFEAFDQNYPFKDYEREACIDTYAALVNDDIDKAREIADKAAFSRELLAKLEKENNNDQPISNNNRD